MCNGKRVPFTATSVNLAGKPAQVGGIAARVFGWIALFFGSTAALFATLIGQWFTETLFGGGWLGYALGTAIMIPTLIVALAGIIGGRKLGRFGEGKARKAQTETIRALAQHKGGYVTAAEAAHALNVAEPQADAMLMELAKRDDEVTLDLTDDGRIVYLFGIGGDALNDPKWRIVEQKAQANMRIAAQQEQQALAEAEALAAEEAAAKTARST